MIKKMVIITCVTIVIALTSILCACSSQNENLNVNTANTFQNVNEKNPDMNSNGNYNSAPTNTASNTNKNTNTNANLDYDPEENVINRDPQTGRVLNREDGLTFEQRQNRGVYTADDNTLAQINQDKIKNVASDFLYAFLTYTADDIIDGTYPSSYLNYVDTAYVMEKKNSDIYYHQNREWLYAVSTYPETYYRCLSVNPRSVYISHSTQFPDVLAVRCEVVYYGNQDNWGAWAWDIVNEYTCSYAVYFDSETYQVLDVKEQTKNMTSYNVLGMDDSKYSTS